MPTVPRYQPQVAPRALPGVRRTAALSPQAAGAGVAAAQGELEVTKAEGAARNWALSARIISPYAQASAEYYGDLRRKEEEEADKTAVLDSQNQFLTAESERLYGKNGFYTRQGRAAFTLPEEGSAWFEETSANVTAGLTNDRQRAMFDKFLTEKRLTLDRDLRLHTFNEQQKYQANVENANVELLATEGARHYNSPQAFDLHLAGVESTLKSQGNRLGLPTAQTDAKIADVRNKMHASAISSLVDAGKYQEATKWLEQANKAGQIDQGTYDKLKNAVDVGSVEKQAQQNRDRIIAFYGGEEYDQQIEAAKKIDDPKVQDRTIDYLKEAKQIRDEVKRDSERAALESAYRHLDEGGSMGSMPATMRASLPPGQLDNLERYAERNRPGSAAVKSGSLDYYKAMEQASSDPDAFVKRNIYDLKGRVSPSDFDDLFKAWTGLRKKDGSAEDKLSPFRTQQQAVDDRLEVFGYATSGAKAKPALVAEVNSLVGTWVSAYEKTNKKKPDVEEIKREVDRILSATVTAKPRWWDPQGNLGAVGQTRVVDLTINDVPQAWKDKIKKQVNPTNPDAVADPVILEWYISAMLLDAKK